MVFGLAVEPFWQGEISIDLYIRAYDDSLNFADADFSVAVSLTNQIRVSHSLQLTIATNYGLFVSELTHIVWWVGNVTHYFGDPKNSINVATVEEGSVIIKWSNNSINNVDPPYSCPAELIYNQLGMIQRQEFASTLSQYDIVSVDLGLQGICSEYVSPTTSTTTPTTTPLTTTRSTTTSTTPTTVSTSTTTPSTST